MNPNIVIIVARMNDGTYRQRYGETAIPMADLAEVMALVAEEQAKSAEKIEKQTNKLIWFTKILVWFTAALIILTAFLSYDALQHIKLSCTHAPTKNSGGQ